LKYVMKYWVILQKVKFIDRKMSIDEEFVCEGNKHQIKRIKSSINIITDLTWWLAIPSFQNGIWNEVYLSEFFTISMSFFHSTNHKIWGILHCWYLVDLLSWNASVQHSMLLYFIYVVLVEIAWKNKGSVIWKDINWVVDRIYYFVSNLLLVICWYFIFWQLSILYLYWLNMK
jgi:hypothetical protein